MMMKRREEDEENDEDLVFFFGKMTLVTCHNLTFSIKIGRKGPL
jgi:hypothetical protein